MKGCPQTVTFKGKRFFVCEYTGAFIQKRYFLPVGPHLEEKQGCYVTLPVLLRAMVERKATPQELDEARDVMRLKFEQPNVPVQPPLSLQGPLNDEQLSKYLATQELGLNWLLLKCCETIEDFDKSQVVVPKKRRSRRGVRQDD